MVNNIIMARINIIENIFEKKVTKIGYRAFSYCGITEVTIPDSVMIIDDCAFCDCSSLKSLKIPKNVERLGDAVCSDCNSLEDLTVDSENRYYDSRDNCNAIIETATNTLLYGCKNTIICNSVDSISPFAKPSP